MRTIYLETRDPYIIGKTGESQRTALRVDVEEWYQDYTDGTGMLLFVRPNKVAYPLETNLIEHDGKHYLETIVTSNETRLPGWVVITAQWYDGATLLHGRTYSGKVLTSNGTNVTDGVMETTPTWVAELIDGIQAINETATTVQDAYTNMQTALGLINEALQTAQETVQQANNAANSAETAKTNAETYKNAAAASAAAAAASEEAAMTDTPGGYAAFVGSMAAAYSTSSGYAVGDYVLKDGQLYRCVTAIGEEGESWTAAHWTAATAANELNGVREEMKNAGLIPIPWVMNSKYIKTDTDPVDLTPVTSSGYHCTVLDCQEGDVFTVTGNNNSRVARIWTFIDGEGNVLKQSEVTSGTVTDHVITAPVGTAKLILNNLKSLMPGAVCYYGENVQAVARELQAKDSLTEKYLLSVESMFVYPGHINADGSIVEDNPEYGDDYLTTGWIPVKAGDVLHYKLKSRARLTVAAAFDTDKTPVDSVSGAGSMYEGTYTVAQDGYLRLTTDRPSKADAYAYINDGMPDRIRMALDAAVAGSESIAERIEPIEKAAGESIPDYWQEAADEAVAACQALDVTAPDGDRFFFITDPHWNKLGSTNQNYHNRGHSPDLISYISRRTGIRKVLCGGDVIWNTVNTVGDGVTEIRDFYDAFKDRSLMLMPVAGNHETRGASDPPLSNAQIYNLLGRQMEHFAETDAEKLCFCYDNKGRKIRYIGFHCTGYETVPLGWVGDRIDEATALGYTVVLISHTYWDAFTKPTEIENGEGANERAAAAAAAFLEKKANGADIACWLVGHIHIDADYTLTDNVNGVSLKIISTRTDNEHLYNTLHSPDEDDTADYHTDTMDRGTDTEQAFDIVCVDPVQKEIHMVRVGGGSDRDFEYD